MSHPRDDQRRSLPHDLPDLADREQRQLWARFLADDPLSLEEQSRLVPLVGGGGPSGALAEDEQLHRTLAALGWTAAEELGFPRPAPGPVRAALDADRFVAAVERRIDGRAQRSRARGLGALAVAFGAAAVVALWFAGRRSPDSARVGPEPDGRLAAPGGFAPGKRAGAPAPVPGGARGGTTPAPAAGTVAAADPAPLVEASSRGAAASGYQPPRAPAAPAPPGAVQPREVGWPAAGPGRRLAAAPAQAERPRVSGRGSAPPLAPAQGPSSASVELAQAGLRATSEVEHLLGLAEDLRARGRLQEATGIQSRLLRRQPMAWEPPAPAAYRINAGGPRYVDPRGNVWAADTFFSGGRTFGAAKPVAGTSLEPLYQTERNGVGSAISYELPLANGRYVVFLHFAEIYGGIGATNPRRFDVFLEREKVLASYDIQSDVGPATAVVRPFLAEVDDGALTIDFTHVAENPKVSAIEVYPLPAGASPPPLVLLPAAGRPRPAPPPPSARAVYRINAGGPAFQDPDGNTWSADGFSSGGMTNRTKAPIAGTTLQALYQNERFAWNGGRLSYDLPVENGAYAVHLHFAEIYPATALPNRRAFDVFLEGERILQSFDISAEAGSYTAVVKPFVTEVRDGRLAIELRPVIENVKISGIEVFALDPGVSPPAVRGAAPLPLAPSDALYRVNAGGGEYIDPEGRRWEPDRYDNDAGRGIEQDLDIQGTDLDPLYQRQRWASPSSRNLAYSFPVPEGEYLLRLHFAEISGAARAPGRRVFDVQVEKTEALGHLDVAAAAGFATVLVKELKVAVLDGALDVELRPVLGGTRIAALEVLPIPRPPSPEPPSASAPTPDPAAAPVTVQPNAGCAMGGRPGGPGPALIAWLAWGIARRCRRGKRPLSRKFPRGAHL